MSKTAKWFLGTMIAILIIISVSMFVNWYTNTPYAASVAAISAGLLSFAACVIVSDQDAKSWLSDSANIRAAIAISILIEYLVLVGMSAFFASAAKDTPPVTQTLLTSFTTVVGIVVVFYFGTSAYVQAQQTRAQLALQSGEHKPDKP